MRNKRLGVEWNYQKQRRCSMEYHFNDIAGYEDEKAELKRLCDVISNQDRVERLGGEMPKGIVFYGETGTGKTLFANVLASECGLQVISINVGDVNNSVQICRRIRRAFERAAKGKSRYMIFFDELDKVLPNAAEGYLSAQSKTILAQLLTAIDGMHGANNFIFVATCNDYMSLPPTLVRPGRIDKKIYIGNPSYASRVEILTMYAQRTSCRFEITMEELAKLSSGFSGAALKTLINECVLQSDENGFIAKTLVTERILEIKNEDIPRGKSSVSDSIIACRNLGTFVVARAFNSGKYVVNLDCSSVGNNFFNKIIGECDDSYDDDDSYGYYCEDDDDENDDDHATDNENSGVCYYTKSDFLNTICVLLGGYAAEELIFNKTYDNLASHVSNVESILLKMSQHGMFGLNNIFLSWRDRQLCYTDEFVDRLNKIFADTIDECYAKAKSIVSKNKSIIKKLMPILVEKEFIDDKICEPIIKELGGIKV